VARLKRTLLLAAFCGLAYGQTALTTIQDTLFKADGTLFNGSLTVQWSTFDANNIGTIVQQSEAISVVNGNLFLQLVPNATAVPPANVYKVHYQSDGREQFAETWTVPTSTVPLRVSQVRVGSQAVTSTGGEGGSDNSSTRLQNRTSSACRRISGNDPLRESGSAQTEWPSWMTTGFCKLPWEIRETACSSTEPPARADN